MNLIQAVILGLVQGVAEFLPISSSGHLKIAERLMGLADIGTNYMFFDVMLHFATLVAVILAYRKEIAELLTELLKMCRLIPSGGKREKNVSARRLIVFLIISLLPLFAILPVKDWLEALGSGLHATVFIGVTLILSGMLLYFSDRLPAGKKDEKSMTALDAVAIGAAQALAVIPGLSRSGATITMGTVRGLNRPLAVKFSFLMSIPTVLAATMLEVIDAAKVGLGGLSIWVCLPGMLVAGISGYFAITFLKRMAERGRFGGFAFWCWGAGLFALIISLIS